MPPPRAFVAKASRVSLAGVEGSVLFPTLQQGPWLPLERLAESSTTGAPESDLHSHEKEEVVNYVLAGTATYIDEAGGGHDLAAGMVAVLSSFEPARHDLIPKDRAATRWLSLVARLPRPRPPELPPLQFAPADARRTASGRLRWLRCVGDGAPASSSVGLELAHLTFLEPERLDLPTDPGRRIVAYTLEGSPLVGNGPVGPRSGWLAEGWSTVRIDGKAGDQVALVSVPSRPG